MNEQILIVTRGIPGSGKSYWAEQWVAESPENRRKVERDDLRKLHFGKYGGLSDIEEDFVTRVQHSIIRNLLALDYSVVVSDTNLNSVQVFKDMAMVQGCKFEVKVFDTPLDVCLQRNAQRERVVPEEVIIKMQKRLDKMKKKLNKVEERPLNVSSEKQPAFMFDLDGTIRLMNGRNPYSSGDAVSDMPNSSVILVLKGLMVAYPDAKFIAMSGANSNSWKMVRQQLEDFGIAPDFLFMRGANDQRGDDVVKSELYLNNVADRFNVIAVFDDRDKVVNCWRELGLHVFQVAPGDF